MALNVSPKLGQSSSSVPIRHLCQEELARRWRVSSRTLERWRWLRQGPKFIRIGGAVRYRLCDVEAYEEIRLQDAQSSDNGSKNNRRQS